MNAATSHDPRSLLTTGELYRRAPRSIDLHAEAVAMRQLTRLIADSPPDGIQRFLDITLELCDAGSTGLSILADAADGSQVFRWDALSGALADHAGGITPADFSPCGLCLAEGRSILLDRPARVFRYFEAADPQIVEGLIVPLYDTGRVAIGTLWIVSHDEARRFDAETLRRMEQFAPLMVLAIRLRLQDRRLGDAMQMLADPAARSTRLRARPI